MLGQLAKQGRGERCRLQMNVEALEPLVQGAVRAAREMGARELANVAYGAACSGSGESLGALFALLARVAQRRVGEFNAQELANTAWAFATADQSDAPLFALVARVAQRCVGEFNAQDLRMTSWALSRRASLNDAWTLIENSERVDHSSTPLCFGVRADCRPSSLPILVLCHACNFKQLDAFFASVLLRNVQGRQPILHRSEAAHRTRQRR